jgi:Domain of unknown function (DUF4371)/hAT family C-terminal dimerisation region
MSNEQDSKRAFSANENPTSKKNKKSEQLISSTVSSNPSMQVEFIDLSDEANNSDRTISSEETEEVSEKSHTRKTANSKWFKDYSWLKADYINENTILYCEICRERNGNTIFARGTYILRLSVIKEHLKTMEHKKSEELLKTQENQSSTNLTITKQMDTKKSSIISLMMNAYLCSKENLALNIYSKLCKLMSLQIKNEKGLVIGDKNYSLKPASIKKPSLPKSIYGSHTNDKSGFEFLESIVSVIQKNLFEELNLSSHWSIMIDETNTITNNKYLAIVGKYMVDNMPYMRYLGMVELESTDGENIFNQIRLFCNDNEISSQRIIHFGSDGASNMTGYKSGVAARLRKMNPFMSSNHCVSHRLHLAGKDASDKVLYFEKYEETLKNLYAFFSRSYRRQNLLKMMQDINDEPSLVILNMSNTRWLSFSNSVSNLYRIMNSVLAALNDDAQEGDRQAQLLYDQLDQEFILVTMYLADLTNILKRLINIFQLDFLSFSQFKKNLENVIKEIEYEFVGNEQSPPNNGRIFREHLDSHHLDSPPFVKEYSIAIIDAIQRRFPQTELYSSFSIFDPKEIPDDDNQLNSYGIREIEFLGKFYGETKYVDGNEFQEIIDKNKLFDEWCLVKYILQVHKSDELDFISFWKLVLDTDEGFPLNYPNIAFLVKIALIIPLSNANVERIFSQTKLIKDKIRNKMNINTLNNHLMIKLNGPDIEDFNFEEAYKHWVNEKKRRVR